jgi:hypothetical protein
MNMMMIVAPVDLIYIFGIMEEIFVLEMQHEKPHFSVLIRQSVILSAYELYAFYIETGEKSKLRDRDESQWLISTIDWRERSDWVMEEEWSVSGRLVAGKLTIKIIKYAKVLVFQNWEGLLCIAKSLKGWAMSGFVGRLIDH